MMLHIKIMKNKASIKYILISIGSICIGLFIYQLFIYDLSTLSTTKSILSNGSVLVIGITSILSGILIKK